MATPEGIVEDYFKTQVELAGGLPLKFKSPSSRGVPDQLVLYDGQTFYAEIKAPGKKPRKDQLSIHKKFKKHGVTVYIIDSKEQTDWFIREILNTVAIKPESNKSSKPVLLKNAFDL